VTWKPNSVPLQIIHLHKLKHVKAIGSNILFRFQNKHSYRNSLFITDSDRICQQLQDLKAFQVTFNCRLIITFLFQATESAITLLKSFICFDSQPTEYASTPKFQTIESASKPLHLSFLYTQKNSVHNWFIELLEFHSTFHSHHILSVLPRLNYQQIKLQYFPNKQVNYYLPNF
jgi:hypothetical protein